MINFPTNPTAFTLESCLAAIRQQVGQSLRIPISQRWGGGYGAAAQAVQTIATWGTVNDGQRIVRVPEAFFDSAQSKDRLASTLPGMAALYFADEVRDSTRALDRYQALTAVAPRVEAMRDFRFADTMRGIGVALCCFSGARGEFLPSLYATPNHGGVRGVSGFQVLMPRLIRETAGRSAIQIPEGQIDHLSHLAYELFANADEHGSFDISGNSLRTSIRGLVVRQLSFSDLAQFIQSAGTDNPLRSYLSKAAVMPVSFAAASTEKADSPPETAQFLEVSVFDCGPGLALRWLSKHGQATSYSEISHDEELEAVRVCFKKHATTRSLSGSGQGLTQALIVMKRLRAFMAVRTGRLSLFQDFTRSDTVDFSPGHRFRRRNLAQIAGTSFTICFRIK